MDKLVKVFNATIKQSFIGAKEAIETTICKAEFGIDEDGFAIGFMHDDDGSSYLLAGVMVQEKGLYLVAFYLDEPDINPTSYELVFSDLTLTYFGIYRDYDKGLNEILGKAFLKINCVDNNEYIIEDFLNEYNCIVDRVSTSAINHHILEDMDKVLEESVSIVNKILRQIPDSENDKGYIC